VLLERDPRLGVDGHLRGVGGVRLGGDGHPQQVGVVDEAAVVRQDVDLEGRLGQEPEVGRRGG